MTNIFDIIEAHKPFASDKERLEAIVAVCTELQQRAVENALDESLMLLALGAINGIAWEGARRWMLPGYDGPPVAPADAEDVMWD